MKPIKRIVVATDFSDCSRSAIDYALHLAERLDAEVELLHVFERPVYFDVGIAHSLQVQHGVEQWLKDLRQEADQRLRALAEELRRQKAVVRTVLREGRAVDEILKAAQPAQTDLVVLGTHGRTGLPHVVLGSVAERVVRQAPCPVLTVRSPAVA